MKIIQLELYKYLRFMVKGISYFKYNPDTVIQIILGSNGSGKSSLLKELSPLPAALKDEFDKGGYKKISILHNNSRYDLLSESNEKGNIFSFIKDDIELNPGHTVSVYRDLVRLEFGITQDIHDLMIGQSRFCDMDTGTRRSWFTRLPSTDYTYAIRYYKKLSEALRDSTGAIKHISGKLIQEKDKEISKEEMISLKEDLKHLRDYLAYILENKSTNNYSVADMESELIQTNDTIVSTYKRLGYLITSFDNPDFATCVEDLVEQKNVIQTEIVATTQLISRIFQDAHSLELSIDELEKNNADSVEQLQTRMSERKKYIVDVIKTTKLGIEFKDPPTALDALDNCSLYLFDITNELQEDPTRSINREYYDKLNDKVSRIKHSLEDNASALSFIQNTITRLEHLRDHDNTECPKCKFTFNRSFTPTAYQEELLKKETLEAKAVALTKDLNDTKLELERVSKQFDTLSKFTQLTRGYPILDAYWDYFRKNILFTKPSQALSSVQALRHDLSIYSEVHKLEGDEAREADILKTMMVFKNQSLSDLKSKFNKLSEEIFHLQNKKTISQTKLKSKEKAISVATEVISLRNDLTANMNKREVRLSGLKDVIRNELQGKLIQAVQYEISVRESRLSTITSQQSIIDELEKQLDTLKKRKDVLKAAVDVLSPSEGLIAKGITGFINHFIKQMNGFIKNIWSYPLELIAITPDENLDLDYRFEVRIGEKGKAPDISKISKGQKEIVDLAFKIVAGQYLGLSHSSLYLDEFGSSFDKEHRQAVAEMMHGLTTTSTFSQIYIISHYEEMYGSFKNTDITVFHDPKFESMEGSAFNKVATFG